MLKELTVALHVANPALRENLMQHLEPMEDVVLLTEKGNPVAPKAWKAQVLLVADDDPEPLTRRIEALRQHAPEAAIFALSEQVHPEHVVATMRAGATEFLALPLDSQALRRALENLAENKPQAHSNGKGQALTFISVKGGLGATVLAVNTAAWLAHSHQRSVLLMDLCFQTGDSAVLLDATPEKTVADLSHNILRLDPALLRGAVTPHRSGAELLAAPTQPEQLEAVQPGHIKALLDLACRSYSQVIIDLPSNINESSLEAMSHADKVFLVTDFSVTAIRDAARLWHLLLELGLDMNRIQLLANRFVKGDAVSIEDAERALGKRFHWIFPNDYTSVIASINRGNPLVLSAPHSPMGKSLAVFIDRLLHPAAAEDHFRGVRGTFGQVL